MRIVFFAKSKRRTQTTRYIAAALRREGHRVWLVNERKRRRAVGASLAREWIVRGVRRFGPDLVLVHSNDVSPETLGALAGGSRTVMFTPDCWSAPFSGDLVELAKRVDLLLTVAKGQIPQLLDAGVKRAAYLAEACDPSAHFPVDDVADRWRSDVAFIGKTSVDSPRSAARRELVHRVWERFDTKVYGRGWEALGIDPQQRDLLAPDYPRVCRGARVVLGRDWTTDCDGYTSNRTWFTLGCGGFLITNYSPCLEEIVTNREHLVWYRSDDECLELIEHYLARPDERARIAASGRAYVLAHRTYDHFARDLIARVEGREPDFPPAFSSR